MKPTHLRPAIGAIPRRQRGVVLLFALIALAIMMIASVALVRSFNSTLYTAGNIAFKRDMQNQAQRGLSKGMQEFLASGQLFEESARSGVKPQYNYSAKTLNTTAEGVPEDLLLKKEDFDEKWKAGTIALTDQGIEIRHVVDRLCDREGLDSELGAARCQLAASTDRGGSGSHLGGDDGSGGLSGALPVIYRISVRVDGPRGSQSFYQSTFTMY